MVAIMRILLTFVFLLIVCSETYPISVDEIATKHVRFYTPSDYKSDAQVWSVSKGENDDMFFATNEGVVLNDGVRWEKYTTPSECIMRSVFYDKDDQILYSGGVNEIGYWQYNEFGNLFYTLLYENPKNSSTKEFWKIVKVPGTQLVYFQSPLSLLVYNTQTKVFNEIPTDNRRFNSLFVVDGKIYLQQENVLYILDGMTKKIVTEDLAGFYIIYISRSKDGKLQLFTPERGTLLVNTDGKIVAGTFNIADVRITSMCRFGDKYLIGTGNSGFYMVDENGTVVSKVSAEQGLKNSILSLGVSNQGDIWMGLNGGIMTIEESVKEEVFLLDSEENIGYVYCCANQNEEIYLGTNRGLYEVIRAGKENSFRLMTESKGQVWNLYTIDNRLYVAHNKGLFYVSGNMLKEIKHGGVYTLSPIPSRPGWFISGNYDGLSVYKMQAGSLKFSNNIKGHKNLVQNCLYDKNGNLWVSHSRKEFMRIRFDEAYTTIVESEIYTIPADVSKRAFMLLVEQDILFVNNEGVSYKYNELNNMLQVDEYYTSLLKPINQGILNIQYLDGLFWQINENGICMLRKDYNKVLVSTGLFSNVREKFIPKGFRKIIQLGEDFAIGLQNGLGIVNISAINERNTLKRPEIKKAEIVGESNKHFLNVSDSNLFIPAHINMVTLWLTSLSRNRQVEYRIKERSENWETSSTGYLNLSYLRPGDFTLEIRNSDGYGTNSDLTRVHLHIKAPWYATGYAYGFYVLLLIGIIFLIGRIILIKERKKEQQVKLNEERKRKEELELYQLNCLQEELGNKNSKLMSITMLGVQNNTFLKKIRDKVLELESKDSTNEVKLRVQKLIREIDRQLNDQTGWDNFAEHFNNTCNGFFDRLTEKHPKLTNSDLRLCAYIRLNLSTKEIASLLNVSSNSVEMAKYRLRKKLDLDESISLPYYLTEVIATLESFVNN